MNFDLEAYLWRFWNNKDTIDNLTLAGINPSRAISQIDAQESRRWTRDGLIQFDDGVQRVLTFQKSR